MTVTERQIAARTAHPYDDTDVIDERAPRVNQAFVGSLSLLAFVLGLEWLPGLVGLQLLIGLTLGRRWCLWCLLYFEVIQPRLGEGPIEDSRPPRFANMVGVLFLGSATLAFVLGAATGGWVLTLIVAALALLSAITGFCMGCEMYRLTARLRGISPRHVGRVDPADFGLNGEGVLEFTHPLCTDCRGWEERLRAEGRPPLLVDVSERPELARKYGVSIVPTVLAVAGDGTVVERLAP